ncbi:hypothetical protein Acsp05_49760 [Actinokineospora sp. NBRC 105648]|nr:hypothetical protein Acsp05_49760 [Actinokineospora sp. NBRC 105648]
MLALLVAVGLVVPPAVAAAAPGGGPTLPSARVDQLPLVYTGDAGQLITVVAKTAGSQSAVLTGWRRSEGGWVAEIGPVSAFVGSAGIGIASEGSTRTPVGVHTLTEAFGHKPSNGTRLPYRRVDDSDWWVSDVHSPLYNTYQRCAPGTCPFNEAAGEDLGKVGYAYDRAVVIDYNRNPAVSGRGSAFFLHVSTGGPTAGCVSIPAAALDSVLTWLDPNAHPVIDIGVGGFRN